MELWKMGWIWFQYQAAMQSLQVLNCGQFLMSLTLGWRFLEKFKPLTIRSLLCFNQLPGVFYHLFCSWIVISISFELFKIWYTATWNRKSVGASTRWNSIIICKILVYKIGPVPEIGKCGCLYEMKFYIHHLQNFGMQEWSCPWNQKNVVASMRWNSIFIIC